MSGRQHVQSPDVEGSDEWTTSSDGSKYSDSDSSAPEWEADVTEEGELVFIKYHQPPEAAAGVLAPPPPPPPPHDEGPFQLRGDFKRSSTRRASKGKIFKALRNRYKQTKNPDVGKERTSREESLHTRKVEPQTTQEECPSITIQVDRCKIFYSDKGCQLEQMFGISVNKTEDTTLTLMSVLPEARALYEPRIKRGFSLQKINGVEVSASNIYEVLQRTRNERQFNTLTFTSLPQEALSIEFKNLLTSKTEHEFVLSQILRDSSVSVVYICCDVLNENSSDDRGVLYCYPRPYTQNFLYNTRGAFITLNHLTPKGLSVGAPLSSTILVNDVLINVVYVQRGEDLMLLAIPNSRLNLSSVRMAAEDIVNLLEFLFGSLRKGFSERDNLYKIDHLFSRFFAMIVCGFDGADAKLTVSMQDAVNGEGGNGSQFERTLPLAHKITLPRQVRLQIDDALSEFEAADYREWTDDLLNGQRLFVVSGCCVWYSGYLLSSHLTDEELRDVHAFLRVSGLLQLSRLAAGEPLVWREVFPATRAADCASDCYSAPEGRQFLLVVGKGHFLLASIMETGGCTEEPEAHPPPSPFYVEEAQSCLELLLDVGLEEVLACWLRSDCRPQLCGRRTEVAVSCKGDSNKPSTPKSSGPSELQSILKRRHHSSEQLHATNTLGSTATVSPRCGSQHNLHGSWYQAHSKQLDASFSEDSASQQSNSEAGDERVAGRRAERARGCHDSSGSDSEWEGQGGSRTSGSLDMSDLRRSLLEEVNKLAVHRVTAGEENVLLHYVQLQSARGVLLAPARELETGAGSPLYSYILSKFRVAADNIHVLLQNTIRFKKSLCSASSVNKSLVAVRERGVLLQAPAHLLPPPAAAAAARAHKLDSYRFWVVGRLFSEPEPKELYVCYHESVPQDLLEIAYRLSFLE